MRAVVEEARTLGVPLHRISQGSGVMMLRDNEISSMVALGEESDVEVCLFLGPRGHWDIGAAAVSSSRGAGPRARGIDQLGQCLEGVRDVLVADEGVLWAGHRLRASGVLPADFRFKVSVLVGPVNPTALQVVAGWGGDSIQCAQRSLDWSTLRNALRVASFNGHVRRVSRRHGWVRATLRRSGSHQSRCSHISQVWVEKCTVNFSSWPASTRDGRSDWSRACPTGQVGARHC
jgi:hypothetical protein